MRTILGAAAVAALGLSLCACATVTRGTTTQFKVVSTPPGAAVKTSTGFACSPTPCSMKMPRKTAFDATITLAGYQPATHHIDSKVSGGGAAGFVGNAVAGGGIGMVIDGTDGAMNDLTPNPLTVALEPAAPAAPATPPGTPTASTDAPSQTASAAPSPAH